MANGSDTSATESTSAIRSNSATSSSCCAEVRAESSVVSATMEPLPPPVPSKSRSSCPETRVVGVSGSEMFDDSAPANDTYVTALSASSASQAPITVQWRRAAKRPMRKRSSAMSGDGPFVQWWAGWAGRGGGQPA